MSQAADRADLYERLSRDPRPCPGKHRAIRQHAFVLYRGDEQLGCGRPEDPEDGGENVRCGYYQRHHPTMIRVVR